ncbi:MAG: flagellar basal body rod protein FlgB [Aquificae bacterium]|nr:flagellar basal body rod protein FlgB [Aquificota bacterium]
MSDLFSHLDDLQEKASFYLERTKVIQGNIANADTPFYRPVDIKFEKVFYQQVKLKRTHPKHLDPFPYKETRIQKYVINNFVGYDQNRVNVEEELAKLAESSIMYKTLLESMKKEMAKLKYAITGR